MRGRAAWRLWHDGDSNLAVGGDTTYVFKFADSAAGAGAPELVRLRERPELNVDDNGIRLIVTGNIDASRLWEWGLEAAGNWHNLYAQGGYFDFDVTRRATSGPPCAFQDGGSTVRNRVSRFTMKGNAIDPKSERVLIENLTTGATLRDTTVSYCGAAVDPGTSAQRSLAFTLPQGPAGAAFGTPQGCLAGRAPVADQVRQLADGRGILQRRTRRAALTERGLEEGAQFAFVA